jgi:NAD(P)-dependent dehydrogenase (short-subunit alcohol dehydrogenase family)
MKLKNRVAVVTGGGRGIGRAIALTFAQEGAKLVLMARSAGQVEAVCNEARAMGAEALAVTGDIAKKVDVLNLVQKTLDRFGPPDILVNNASISRRALTVDYEDEAWQDVIQTNLTGTFFMTKYFLRTMIPRKTGRIINIASVAAKTPHPFNSAYSASKHGILGLTRTLAAEMGIMGTTEITINAICPGPVRTDMLEGENGLFQWLMSTQGMSREDAEKRLKSLTVQGRMLDPQEIAGLVLYLASDEAKGITGQAISIDGGQAMC